MSSFRSYSIISLEGKADSDRAENVIELMSISDMYVAPDLSLVFFVAITML